MKEEKAMKRADSNQTENEKSSSFAFALNRKVYPEWEIFSQFFLEWKKVKEDVAVNAGIREKIWSRKSARTMQVRLSYASWSIRDSNFSNLFCKIGILILREYSHSHSDSKE